MLVGRVPLSVLLASSIVIMVGNLSPISLGSSPPNPFPLMFKKLINLDRKSGKEPSKPEFATLNISRMGRSSTSCGMVPINRLPNKSRTTKLVNCPSPGGMVPKIPTPGNVILVTE